MAYNKDGSVRVGVDAGENHDDVFIHNPYQRYFFPTGEEVVKASGEKVQPE